jgi:AcrR family transcriptional regulator
MSSADHGIQRLDGRRAAGASTRRRLLKSATQIVVDSGLDALTVRAVSEAAGTNVASVSYHFGSRDALMAAVVETLSEPIVERQSIALTELEESAEVPAVADWVAAWGRPLLNTAFSSSPASRRLGQLIGQALASPGSGLDAAVRQVVVETDEQFIKGMRRTLPDVAEAELRLRLAVMVAVVTGLTSGVFDAHLARAAPDDRLEERVLDLLAAIGTGLIE